MTSPFVCAELSFGIPLRLPKALEDSDYHPVDKSQAQLGRLLFYDKILSGNRNISCATCHHPKFGTSDGLSLGIGEGGEKLGVERSFGSGKFQAKRRVPRNAASLWNIGAREFKSLFHDGRISESKSWESGFDSPAEEFLPHGLSDIVAVQVLFPITAEVEMAGNKNENEIPGAARRRFDYAWRILTERVRNIAQYETDFIESFDDIKSAKDITITHIANAISAFERFEFRADQSPFDRYLRGETSALNASQLRGMLLFYGKANCVQCHRGPLLTDHDFHNIALPFLGPGRTRKFEFKARDMGRINETDKFEDSYKFATPSLRNISLTAPYGHNGAYKSLEGMVRHHLNPVEAFKQYNIENAVLPAAKHIGSDQLLWQDSREKKRLLSTTVSYKIELRDNEITDIIEFLHGLTDEASAKGRLGIPDSVPSGLPVDQ
ncbi:MAG: methylamine utilization protein MauG [SAR324 cluster bacterium]|nr:methylamine utilization protein MauG [SAR324 cluster bacterium]